MNWYECIGLGFGGALGFITLGYLVYWLCSPGPDATEIWEEVNVHPAVIDNAGRLGYNIELVTEIEMEIYGHEWFNATIHAASEFDLYDGRLGWRIPPRKTTEVQLRGQPYPHRTPVQLVSPLGMVEVTATPFYCACRRAPGGIGWSIMCGADERQASNQNPECQYLTHWHALDRECSGRPITDAYNERDWHALRRESVRYG